MKRLERLSIVTPPSSEVWEFPQFEIRSYCLAARRDSLGSSG